MKTTIVKHGDTIAIYTNRFGSGYEQKTIFSLSQIRKSTKTFFVLVNIKTGNLFSETKIKSSLNGEITFEQLEKWLARRSRKNCKFYIEVV